MIVKTPHAIIVLMLAVALISCNNEDDPAGTTFFTQPATQITSEGVILNGDLTIGDTEMIECGFVYSTVSNRNLNGYTSVSLGVLTTNGSYSHEIDELIPGTIYYFRAL